MGVSERALAMAARYGVPAERLAGAGDDVDVLAIALDWRVRPGALDMTLDEVSAAAGVDPAFTRRVWRSLGFPAPSPGEPVGSADDALVLAVAHQQVESVVGVERMVRQTRVISAAVRRIAELWSDEVREALDAGMDPATCGELYLETFDLDRLTFLIGYVHRHQVQTALRREFAARRATGPGGVGEPPRVVGFADLVDFTPHTERLTGVEIAALVEAFEAFAFDAVAEHGARLVKTIGDEVLFVGDDVGALVDLATVLAGGAPDLPALRVGLDLGPVIHFEGDIYGPSVNRAARIVAQAAPSTVAASATVRAAHPAGATWASLGERSLKGIGPAELFRVT